MAQPKGSFANNSNTLVAGLAEKAGKLLEVGLNINVIPLGTMAKQARERRAGQKFEQETLGPVAGVKGKSNLIRDILSKKE
jgi:hypothetical protein